METNRKKTDELQRINEKIWQLYQLLNPEKQLEGILIYKNLADLFDNTIVLVKALLHNIESFEREKTGFLILIERLKEDGRRFELTNQAFEIENDSLRKELKRLRKKPRRR